MQLEFTHRFEYTLMISDLQQVASEPKLEFAHRFEYSLLISDLKQVASEPKYKKM